MKADFVSLDAARAERPRYNGPWRGPVGLPGAVRTVLVAAGLAMIGCGIVSVALWTVWTFAELVP